MLVGHFPDEVPEVLLVHGLREEVEDEEVGVAHLADDPLDVLLVHVAAQVAAGAGIARDLIVRGQLTGGAESGEIFENRFVLLLLLLLLLFFYTALVMNCF